MAPGRGHFWFQIRKMCYISKFGFQHSYVLTAPCLTPDIVFLCTFLNVAFRVRAGAAPMLCIFFFPPLLFGRIRVNWYKIVLLGNFQAQTVLIQARLQMCLRHSQWCACDCLTAPSQNTKNMFVWGVPGACWLLINVTHVCMVRATNYVWASKIVWNPRLVKSHFPARPPCKHW